VIEADVMSGGHVDEDGNGTRITLMNADNRVNAKTQRSKGAKDFQFFAPCGPLCLYVEIAGSADISRYSACPVERS